MSILEKPRDLCELLELSIVRIGMETTEIRVTNENSRLGQATLRAVTLRCGRLSGVVHAAGVLDDGLLLSGARDDLHATAWEFDVFAF